MYKNSGSSAESLNATLRVIGDMHKRNPDMQLTAEDVQKVSTIGRKEPGHAFQALRVLYDIALVQSAASVAPDKNIYDRLNRSHVYRTAVNGIDQIARANPAVTESALHTLTSLLAERPDNLWIGIVTVSAMREAMQKNRSCDEGIIRMLDKLSKVKLDSDRLSSVLNFALELGMRNGGEIAVKAVEILGRHLSSGPLAASKKSPLFHIAELGRTFPTCEKNAMRILISESGHTEHREEACKEIVRSYEHLRASFDEAVNPKPAKAPVPVLNSKKPAPKP